MTACTGTITTSLSVVTCTLTSAVIPGLSPASDGKSSIRKVKLETGEVLQAKPGEVLFHPFISNAGERGPFVAHDACAQFFGLRSHHRYRDLMRAVMEGLAFAARDCYAAMGALPRVVRITGGAARSRALGAIFGATLECDIQVCNRGEAGAAGAAMIAAVAIGFYPDMTACAEDWEAAS